MNKPIVISLLLIAVAAISIGIISQNTYAKDTECNAPKCVFVLKNGDIEIDRATINMPILQGPPGQNGINGLNGTTIDAQTLSDLSSIVAAFRNGTLGGSGGNFSLEVNPVDNATVPTNTTVPVEPPVQCQPGSHDESGTCIEDSVTPPVENTTDTGSNNTGTETNSTG